MKILQNVLYLLKSSLLKKGPHGGIFKNSADFFFHDIDHFIVTQGNFDFYDFSHLLEMRKNLPILSLQNRFLNLFAHTYIFEVEYYSDSSNIMDSYNDFYKCPFNSYDLFDYMYL